MLVSGCSTTQSTAPSLSPLIEVECGPKLRPFEGRDMGDLLQWAVYSANRFNRCREAALQSGG